MKKVFSIVFSLLILISGLHLSFASHICCGELAAVKISFDGTQATCGMEKQTNSCPSKNRIKSNCCKDIVSYCSVDNNYDQTSFHVKDVTKNITQLFYVTCNTNLSQSQALYNSKSVTNNPDNLKLSANAVSLAHICVFRI